MDLGFLLLLIDMSASRHEDLYGAGPPGGGSRLILGYDPGMKALRVVLGAIEAAVQRRVDVISISQAPTQAPLEKT